MSSAADARREVESLLGGLEQDGSDATLARLIPAYGAALGCDRVLLFLRDPISTRNSMTHSWYREPGNPETAWADSRLDWPTMSPTLLTDDPMFAEALRNPEALYIEDVESAPAELLSAEYELEHFGHRALIHAPLYHDAAMWGILEPCTFGPTPRVWSEEDRALTSLVQSKIGRAVADYVRRNCPGLSTATAASTTARGPSVSPAQCLPDYNSELRVAGLEAPVSVAFDEWHIPHIKASSTHDAFFAQGFVIGQDRLFQLDYQRRLASGTGAALISRGLLRRDIQNRRLGYRKLAEAEWEEQSAAAQEVLQAYADGVNAAIATQPLPYEFHHLGQTTIEPWTPIDSLAVIKMVNDGAQWATKIKHGQLAATLGTEALLAYLPDMPSGSSLITPAGATWTEATHSFTQDVESAVGYQDQAVGGGGSNCWIVGPERSASGKPLVCGDPHLAISVPGQWMVMCATPRASCVSCATAVWL